MKGLEDKTLLGKIEMKNRFIRAAVGDITNGGHLTSDNYETYSRLAKGGVAAIVTGFSVVDKEENKSNIFSMAEDIFIPEYKKLTDIIHDAGSKAVIQLAYLSGMVPIKRPLSPSASKNIYTGIETFGMTINEIHDMIYKFAEAAYRAKEAGFDGVELHAAHGFLHHQFFSPIYNQRSDEYGGIKENRCRFIIETYNAIRKATNEDFTILIKISTDDGLPNGITEDDYIYLSKELSKLGIDGIETSGSWMSHKPKEQMYYKDAAREIADCTGCKVILTGGNRDFHALEETLNSSNIEYFGFARPFISEPDWVNRYLCGDMERLRCTSCNYCTRNKEHVCIFNAKKTK